MWTTFSLWTWGQPRARHVAHMFSYGGRDHGGLTRFMGGWRLFKEGTRSKPPLLTSLRHVSRSRLSLRSQPKSGSHLNFPLYIYIYIYIGVGSNVNHFLVVNVRTAESATCGGWLGATSGPRRMTRRDSWEGIELKRGDHTQSRHVSRSRLSSRSQPKSGSHLNFPL